MSENIRFILCALLMSGGTVIILISILGVFRFRFVLNRMHCAAIIDTLGALLIIAGLMIAAPSAVYVLKLAAVLCFLWIGSPISSHMVCRMELLTDDDAKEHMDMSREKEADENELF